MFFICEWVGDKMCLPVNGMMMRFFTCEWGCDEMFLPVNGMVMRRCFYL